MTSSYVSIIAFPELFGDAGPPLGMFLTVNPCQSLKPGVLWVQQNGVLKHRVDGANTPDLANHIMALTPLRPDTDEPQDNPMRALLAH